MKYIIKVSLILVYIGIFIFINNSYSTFLLDNKNILQRTLEQANNYKQNTSTILALYASFAVINDYLRLQNITVDNKSNININKKDTSTTNQRINVLHDKEIYLVNLKIKSVYINSLIVLFIFGLIILAKGNIISKGVLVVLMSILFVVMLLIYIFYGFSFNRNNMYLSEYNFPKPNQAAAELSKLKYLDRMQKCGKKPLIYSDINNTFQ